VSWEALWPVIFHEACLNAGRRAKADSHAAGSSATAIILARCAWEAYINELVEWRNLSPSIKGKSFKKGIENIVFELTGTRPSFECNTIWGAMDLVNDLRNAIVHHKASTFSPGDSPYRLLTRLNQIGIPTANQSSSTWERSAICPNTAAWACRTVGQAIVSVEEIPSKRVRMLIVIKQQIQRSLKVI
jgi:hypothetical protein